ncbi:MAG: globin [Paenibacillaceae bacterium]
MNSESTTLYEAIGGEQTVQKLVDAFYPRVEKDPDLAPLFQHGIQEIMRKQFLFLTQFLGGEPLYSNEFGPPQMRFRHLPFEITPTRRIAWLKCMREAMDEIGMEGLARDYFYERLTQVASIMVNTNEEDNE